MKRIVILYGGKSGEHEVSLVSAASIVRHLDPERFEAILVGIDKEGAWRLQEPGSAAAFRKSPPARPSDSLPLGPGPRVLASPGAGLFVEGRGGMEPLACDAAFPVLHGSYGEDGTIQGFLEVAGIPYVGAPVLGSALGMDKPTAKELWLRAGLPVVPYLAVRRGDLASPGFLAALGRKVEARFGWPAFVKPAGGGSSVGASKVAGAEDLETALLAALEWDFSAMIEPYVDGREIECSVLGNEEAFAFPPGEVIPSHEFYDYEAKYVDPEGARLDIPARISPEQAERVKATAIAAYKACAICGMARVDFFIDRLSGEVLLNELNTIPGFTHISMYPKLCEAGGLPYPELISRLIDLALERDAEKKSLRYSY